MQATIVVTKIQTSNSNTNPPPSTLTCSKVDGDMPLSSVTLFVPKADVAQFSEGQQFTVTG